MDAIALIKADHQTVETLFKQFEQAKEAGDKGRAQLVERISTELEVHAQIEEEIFYPRLRAKAEEDGKELVAEAFEEHHLVKILLGELAGLGPDDEAFDAKVTVLMENVRHHVEEEESEMLPQAGEVLGGELAELGRRMAERKRQLLDGGGGARAGDRTRNELYEQAQRLGIPGRSRMNKAELAKAVAGKG
jgi:hemerythrin-like domain-containing protein